MYQWAIPLRWKFVLVLVFGALLPLGLVGFWLTGATERSGEELLRTRLSQALSDLVRNVGSRWATHRSHMADIAELEAVQEHLRFGEPPTPGDELTVPLQLEEMFAANRQDLASILIRDAAGVLRWSLTAQSDGDRGDRYRSPPISVEMGIHDYQSGQRLGTLEAGLRVGSLLSEGAEWVRVAGSVLALFDSRTGDPQAETAAGNPSAPSRRIRPRCSRKDNRKRGMHSLPSA